MDVLELDAIGQAEAIKRVISRLRSFGLGDGKNLSGQSRN